MIRKVALQHKQIQTDQTVGLQAASQALLTVAEACLDEPPCYEVDTVQPSLIYAYICGCGVNLFILSLNTACLQLCSETVLYCHFRVLSLTDATLPALLSQ